MRLRRVPQTPYEWREEPAYRADTVTIRPYQTNWGAVRYAVEARAGNRLLGDRPFALYADALAFARMHSQWHGAKLLDLVKNG